MLSSRDDKDNLQGCICPVHARKSFFGKVDIVLGIIVLIAATVIILVLRQPLVLALVGIILVAFWLPLFVARLIKGHSLSCSARWASIVVLGSLGGFGIFGL